MNIGKPTRSVTSQARLGAVFSVSEVAELAGLSVSAVHQAANVGRLHGIRIGKLRGPGRGGRERIFSAPEVKRFIAERNARQRSLGQRAKRRKKRAVKKDLNGGIRGLRSWPT